MKTKSDINILCFLAICVLCTSCKSPEEKYAYYLEKGDQFYAEADFVKARLEYKNAAKILPSSVDAIYKLGLVEEAEQNFQSALSAFLTAEQQDPEFLPVLLKLSAFFIIAQQYEESSKRVEAVLALAPDNAQAHALKASILLNGKFLRQASRSVDDALANDSANVIAHSVSAGIYMAQERHDEAINVLTNGIKLNPQELSFYLLMATIYSEQNDVDGVTRIYKDIFEHFPEQIRFRHDLASILVEFDHPKEAQIVYEEAIEAFPNNHDAKLKLLQFVETQKGRAFAQETVNAFIKAAPKEKIFMLWLADLYVRSDQYDNAISTLKGVIDTNPNNWIGLNAQTTLAEIQLNRGDMEFALKLLDVVLAEEVNNMDARFLKANLSFFQGDHRKAIADFREILNNAPSFLKASRMLAEALLLQNRINLAIDTLLQAIKHTPGDNATLVRLAQLYAVRGENDTALKVLNKITEVSPSYAIAWESIARIAIENGELDIAEQAIERLVEIGDHDILAQFLKARLNLHAGKTDIAVSQLKDIIRTNINAPIASYALSALVETSDVTRDYKGTAQFLNELDNQTPASLTVLGTLQLKLGQQDNAQESFKSAIAQAPKNQTPYIALARILNQKDLAVDAIKILKDAENADPSSVDALMMTAEILINRSDINEAISVYEHVLERNDNLDAAANNMAQLVADFKYKDNKALENARIAAERFINSDNPDYLDTLGWVYYRSDLPVQAQPILKKAVLLQTSPNPQIDYHYGAVLMKNGEYEEARIHLKRAVSVPNAQYPGRNDAQALLRKLQTKE